MLSVLAITIPIYACVAIGHLAVRRGILDRADMRVLATFVISFALPCMLFLAIATRPVAVRRRQNGDLSAFFAEHRPPDKTIYSGLLVKRNYI